MLASVRSSYGRTTSHDCIQDISLVTVGAWVKKKPIPDDEAARLLDAYLEHVDILAPVHKPDEKIVLVLPDAEVAARRRNAVPPRPEPAPKKKRTRAGG